MVNYLKSYVAMNLKRFKYFRKLVICLALCIFFFILLINSYEIESDAQDEYTNELVPSFIKREADMFDFRMKKCKLIYIKKCRKTKVNQTYFLTNLLNNKEFIAKCSLKVLNLEQTNADIPGEIVRLESNKVSF